MKYMGSKSSIAKYILPIILGERNPNQCYVEPFVGGCNTIDKVDGCRIGGDINKYLIDFWKKLQTGSWEPPREINRDDYSLVRDSFKKRDDTYPDYIKGYIGFNGSYGGRFFDGGYAGTVTTKEGIQRNYPKEAHRNVMKQRPNIQGIEFHCVSYHELAIPENSLIYCDPPYKDTTRYDTEEFDHRKFWNWCRDKHGEGHTIFISEYNAPGDFSCVWERTVSSSLRANSVISGNKVSTERLFTLKKFN
jgi:DNA adenine methylase